VSFENLHAETVGEIEVESKVLVIKRINQTFHLTADESARETIERVLEFYADRCPVTASVKGSIEISSELDLTVA
jgi:uncharacterized OsmC-like protein